MGYTKIILGSDGSGAAERALHTAASLAHICKAELVIAHAYERRDIAEPLMEKSLAAARESGVEARPELRQGLGADLVLELADREEADLIVLGARRQSTGSRFLIGTVSNRVSHHAPCDVLLVSGEPDRATPEGETAYRSILIATDGSPTADRAASRGYDLAGRLGAAVTLVFVGHPKTGELVLKDTAASVGKEEETSLRILQGAPADRILEVAENEKHDLVIVGNKGMAGARRFILGSVPAKVAEYARCDVLIARTVTQAIAELKEGEGGIVQLGDRKVAVYKNESGYVQALSPKCTHMGCTIQWNTAEKTWDCPCHGSRFTPTGAVVHGPAGKPLAKTTL